MAENKKDIIIQVEIASNIYTEIDKLKAELSNIVPKTGAIPVKLDTTGMKTQDWSKIVPPQQVVNIRSAIDKGFHLNIKNIKQALKSLHTDATIPIKITPISKDALTGMTVTDWEKLSPPNKIADNIKKLNSALTSLGSRLNARKFGKGDSATTKSLAQIINDTAAAFDNMAASAAHAASSVGAIKTHGIASDPTKTRGGGGGGGGKSKFDILTFSKEEQEFYARESVGRNSRELKNLQDQLSRNAKLGDQINLSGKLGENNLSGMMDMGGLKGAMSRVLLFGSATSVLYGGIASLRKAIDVTIDLENEMVQLQKVMDDTTPFEAMKKEMFDLSETMGVSILQTTRLAKIWAQQGYDMVGVMRLSAVTLETMNALNVDAAVATDFLTSVTRVWGVELGELQKVLAGVMRVQADYAIESEDLAAVLTKIGSGVREAGDSMAFLSGAATALRESTRKSASQIFTSLKTIYAKSFSDEVVQSLKNVGIYAKSSADTFRPFSDVLSELSRKWGSLNDVERKNLAITIGQTRYWSDFVSLMENFGTVQKATLSFYRAWDDASKASQLQQQSLLNTIKGVGASFAKIGDTFGTKFFTPLVKAVAGPIKSFSDIFANFGGAQSALVFAASLAFLKNAITSVFGVFPAYQKFLGRAGLAGEVFNKNLAANVVSLQNFGTRIRVAGKDMGVLAKAQGIIAEGSGVASKSIQRLASGMTKFNAIVSYGAGVLLNFGKTLGKFAIWTAVFFVAEKIIAGIAEKFNQAKTAADEFADAFPEDVIEKINSLGGKDKKTGTSLSSFVEIKTALDNVVPLLIAKQRELSTSTEKYVLSWKDVQSVINNMSSSDMEILKKNYGDLTTSVEAQKKFWEDIQTTLAIIQNFTFGDTTKKAKEIELQTAQNFSLASGGSEKIKKRLREITGLDVQNQDDFYSKEFSKAIASNIEIISDDPIIKSALDEMSLGLGQKFSHSLSLGQIAKDSFKDNPDSGISRAIVKDLADAAAFSLYSAQDQLSRLPSINLYENIKIGNIPTGLIDDPKILANKMAEGRRLIKDEVSKQVSEITGISKAVDELAIENKGVDIGFGKLFIESPGKASKAFSTLRGELERIRLSYSAGVLFPEDVLAEQQKAYKNYANGIITEYTDANQELARLSAQRAEILSIIQSDPSTATELKAFDPKKQGIDEFLSTLNRQYNEAAEGQEDLAAKGNKVFASNLKAFKATIVALEEAKLNVSELAKAYDNLGGSLQILSRLNNLLEQQAIFDKIMKQNREFLNKQSIDYLKQELTLQEEIEKTIINSDKSVLETYKNNFAKIEELKEKELALHRKVALRKTEIDYIEQKKNIIANSKIIPTMLPIKGFAGIAQLWNKRAQSEKELMDLQLSGLDEVLDSSKAVINSQEDMFVNSQRIANSYSIWTDHLRSVAERSEFIRNVLSDSITDFSRINETHGLSVLTDTIGKIGKRFQEEQAKIFVNSIINNKLGGFVLPSEEDIKFTERLAATRTTFYESVYGAMHAGVTELAAVMGYTGPTLNSQALADRQKMEQEAAGLGDIKKAGNIAALGNLASMIGLSFIGGNDAGKQRGSEIGSVLGAVLPKLLFGANPVVGAISSVVGLFGGGVLGSLFGRKAEKQQDTMIGQLKLIEQNTARVADLTEKLVNIPGSVFLPPTGGFVMNGSIVINANGITNPQEVVDRTVSQLTREFGLSARRSGSRGYF